MKLYTALMIILLLAFTACSTQITGNVVANDQLILQEGSSFEVGSNVVRISKTGVDAVMVEYLLGDSMTKSFIYKGESTELFGHQVELIDVIWKESATIRVQ